jgi:hypothetical protein
VLCSDGELTIIYCNPHNGMDSIKKNEMCCADQFLTSATTKLYRVLLYSVARHGYNCAFTAVQLNNL